MFESIIRENPLLSAAGAAVATILVFLLGAAVLSALGGSKRATAAKPPRREPDFDGRRTGRREASDVGYDPRRRAPPESRNVPLEREPRRGFGFFALMLSFLFGLVGGIAGYVLSSNGQLGSALHGVAALIEAETSSAGEMVGLAEAGKTASAPAPVPPPAASPPESPAPVSEPVPALSASDAVAPVPPSDPSVPSAAAAPAADPAEVQSRLTAFVGKLKESLPREAGPEMSLATVDTTGMIVNLGYTVGRSMEDSEVAQFDGYIMRVVKSLFCGKEAQELRFLNDNGVAFHMTYTDPKGGVVARLTVPPSYCA